MVHAMRSVLQWGSVPGGRSLLSIRLPWGQESNAVSGSDPIISSLKYICGHICGCETAVMNYVCLT